MIDADVLVLASPVYFFSVSAPLKTVIDRVSARWKEVRNKEFYFLVTAAEEEDTTATTTLNCLRGFMDCCEDSVEKGFVAGLGVYGVGEIQQKGERFLMQAYEMGKNV